MVLNFILLDVARPRYTAELIPWGYGPSVMYRRTFVFCIIVPQTATLLTERYAWGAIPSMSLEIILIPYMWLTPYVIDTKKNAPICLPFRGTQGIIFFNVIKGIYSDRIGSASFDMETRLSSETPPPPFHFISCSLLLSLSAPSSPAICSSSHASSCAASNCLPFGTHPVQNFT